MYRPHIVLFVLCVLLVLCPTLHARDYQVFDIVGDSVSAGINPDCFLPYGWAHMLRGQSGCSQPAMSLTITNLWPGITHYNTAIAGSKASDWASPTYLFMNTVLGHHPDLVVILIGGNDGLEYAADGVYTEAEVGEFRTNLTTIVQRLRSNSPPPEIIMMNYYDLFDGYSTNLGASSQYKDLSAATVAGNQIIREVAESNGCFYVDIYSPFMHHCYGGELGDTQHLSPDYVDTPLANFDIHPVTTGHEVIYETVYETLTGLKNMPEMAAPEPDEDGVVLRWSCGINQTSIIERSTSFPGGFVPIATNTGPPVQGSYTASVDGINRAVYRVWTKE